MGDRCGLAFLASLARSTGWHLAITPLPDQLLGVVLDPDGLRLAWQGPIDGHDDTMAELMVTHAPGDVQERGSTVVFVPRPMGAVVESARAMALTATLVDLADVSGWRALACTVRSMTAEQDMFTVCRSDDLQTADVALRLLEQEDRRRRAAASVEVADA
jgi:hypothetical protein